SQQRVDVGPLRALALLSNLRPVQSLPRHTKTVAIFLSLPATPNLISRGVVQKWPDSGRVNMTYCIGIRINAGLVFLSDSRTNAGMDQISTFRKMMIYEKPGDRFIVMLSAGNLSVAQSIRELLQVEALARGPDEEPLTIWNTTNMFDAARVLGATVRRVYHDDGAALQTAGIEFNASLILGGQIKGEAM